MEFKRKLTIPEFDKLTDKEQDEYIAWIDNTQMKGGHNG